MTLTFLEEMHLQISAESVFLIASAGSVLYNSAGNEVGGAQDAP